MNRKTYLAISIGLLATLLAVDVAQAKWRLSIFTGTRAQVANACNGNMEFSNSVSSEGMGFSFCVNFDTGNAVLCSDAGICTGSWNDGVPDATSADRGGPRVRPLTGESLSGSSSATGPAYDSEVPLDPPTDGPIIIN